MSSGLSDSLPCDFIDRPTITGKIFSCIDSEKGLTWGRKERWE